VPQRSPGQRTALQYYAVLPVERLKFSYDPHTAAAAFYSSVFDHVKCQYTEQVVFVVKLCISAILDNSMKVLLIAPQPFFRIRGTPINVKNVASALIEGGHRVDLLCYPFGEDPLDLPDVRIIRGPGCPGIQDVKIGPSLAKIPLDILLFMKAWMLCRRADYDVIHAVEESVFFGVWLSKWFRTQLIYDMDSIISDQLQYSGKVKSSRILGWITRLESWAIRNSTFVLTVCQSLSETTRRLCPETPIVQIEDAPVDEIYAPDPATVDRIRTELHLYGHPVAVYTGNLEPYQGVDLLIKSGPILKDHLPSARILLVGGNPDQITSYKKQVAASGCEEQFIFAGIRPIEEMAAFMETADILLSPRIEGTNTALKVYSYMQSGKAILATDLPTHTQVMDRGCAALVPPEPEAYMMELIRLLSDPQQAKTLGIASAQRVEDQYSLKQFRRKVIEAYANL